MKHRIVATVLVGALLTSVSWSAPVQIAGRVVDKEGKAIAGAEVADYWTQNAQGELKAFPSAKTDREGRFQFECELSSDDQPLLAIDSSRKLGGIAKIRAGAPDKPVVIELSPLVEVKGRFTCTESGRAPGWTHVSVSVMPGNVQLAWHRSRESNFSLKLPAGRYEFHCYGSFTDYRDVTKEVTLEQGKNLDIGAVDLKLTRLGRLYGKELPPWNVTAARGVGKDVKIADFKGRWVVVDFWGFWCGPCVAQSLPGWIDFYGDHAADRSKFEVLAFHDSQATDFTQLDEKLKPLVANNWHGRSLPFPILLDTTGETIKKLGVRAFPTVLVIDPEGHLVKVPEEQGAENYLAARLTPLPPERRFARLLDRGMPVNVLDSARLADQVAFLAKVGRIKIQVEPEELKAIGVDNSTPVPLELAANLSYRAWLNLSLAAFDLTYVPDEDGLKLVRRTPVNDVLARPSTWQKSQNDRVAKALEKPLPFRFHGEPLKKVMAFFRDKTGENFVLDPIARRAGTVKPEMTVSGSNDNESVASGLKALLAPLGMTYVVRDEAVVLTRTPQP